MVAIAALSYKDLKLDHLYSGAYNRFGGSPSLLLGF